MNIILATLAALIGSLFGSAAREGVNLAQRQVSGQPPPPQVSINASIVASAVIGLGMSLLGGVRLAFWLGAVLGAAGADRLDATLFRQVGFDPADLVARATGAMDPPGADQEVPPIEE
jgi:hypothetical protein